jgi:hypothetical protein
MFVPKWFAKELKILDPTYRVGETDDHVGYYIIKDLDLSLKADGGKSLFIPDPKMLRVRGPCVVLWIPELSGAALERLREMKMKALELRIYDNPMNELAFYKAQQAKAKSKKMELAVDMISEGLMEMDRFERRKSFSYGAEDQKEKDHGERHHDEPEAVVPGHSGGGESSEHPGKDPAPPLRAGGGE